MSEILPTSAFYVAHFARTVFQKKKKCNYSQGTPRKHCTFTERIPSFLTDDDGGGKELNGIVDGNGCF